MPRPKKWRKVCSLPERDLFGSLSTSNPDPGLVTMMVEEYETIRLIDLEGLTQEECAEQMAVARTSVQKTYNDARKKIADSLVNGRIMKIEGGDYQLCDGSGLMCGCDRCRRKQFSQNPSPDHDNSPTA